MNATTQFTPDVLTRKQAAGYLSISRGTLEPVPKPHFLQNRIRTKIDNSLFCNELQKRPFCIPTFFLSFGTASLDKLHIPHVQIGRRVVYRRADIDAWLEAQKTGRATA